MIYSLISKYLDSFITNFFKNKLVKSEYSTKTVTFLMRNKII